MVGVCSGDAGKVSTSLTCPGGWPLSPQLLEIQADYHRKSLTSLDTALAELRENHSQAGADMNEPASDLGPYYAKSLLLILKGSRELWVNWEQGEGWIRLLVGRLSAAVEDGEGT